MKKIYVFDDPKGLRKGVEAKTIIDAKKKLQDESCKGLKFYSIRLKP